MPATLAEGGRAATWTDRAATIAMFVANGFGFGAWASSIPSLKAKFALSDGSLSLMLLAVAVGAFVAMPLAGYLASRLGSGMATRMAASFWSVALLLPFLAPSIPWLVPACFLLGFTNGGLDVSMNVHASAVEKRWGAAIMSSFHAYWSAAGLASAGISALVLSGGHGPVVTLAAAAALSALLAAAFWGALRGGQAASQGPGLAFPARTALLLCLAVLLAMLTEGAVSDWSGVYLATVTGAGPSAAVAGYVVFTGAMLAGRIFGDALVRAFGQQRILQAGAAMMAAGLLLAVAMPTYLPSVIGFGLAGFGVANIVPALFSAGSRVGPTPTAGVAMAATSGYAGHLSGPPIMGVVATLAGLRFGILVLAVSAVGIALLARASIVGRS